MYLRSKHSIAPISLLMSRFRNIHSKQAAYESPVTVDDTKKAEHQSPDIDFAYPAYGGEAMSLKKGEWVPIPHTDPRMKMYAPGIAKQTFPMTFSISLGKGIKMGLISAHDPRLKYLNKGDWPIHDSLLIHYLVKNLTSVLESGTRQVHPVPEDWYELWEKKGIFPLI